MGRLGMAGAELQGRVQPFEERWLSAACDLFNRLTAGLPHCFPTHREEFLKWFAAEPHQARDPIRLVVVMRGRLTGLAVGAVNTGPNCDGSFRVAGVGDASIPAFLCEDVSSADRLLHSLEQHFRAVGAERLVMFDAGEHDNNPPFFNAGFAACPEAIPVVCQALARSGFTLANRELHMTRATDLDDGTSTLRVADGGEPASRAGCPPSDPFPLPAGITVRWSNCSPANLEVDAFSGVRNAGGCTGRCLRDFHESPEAASVGYIDWLGINPDFQRQGLGRALLYRMLLKMSDWPIQRVFLTTGSQNWRAQPLYLSMGFGVVGTSVTLVREGV